MNRIQRIEAMQQESARAKQSGQRLALVPTMGALHDGHRALIRRAREAADHVTVSIFVNPTQFGPAEDYDAYPRPLEDDLAALEDLGVDTAFTPTAGDLYPNGTEDNVTWVEVEQLADALCGAERPGHFRGVTTIVAKLFNACRPDVAVFGLKDAQQFLLLERMVADLCFGIELIGVPTVREPDGLALSSRNRYLTPEQRAEAGILAEALGVGREAIVSGELDTERVLARMLRHLSVAPTLTVQYAEVVDPRTVQPVRTITRGSTVLIALAAYLGQTRLIDSAFVDAPLIPAA